MRGMAFAAAMPLRSVWQVPPRSTCGPRMSVTPSVAPAVESSGTVWLGSVLDAAAPASPLLAESRESAATAARAADLPGRSIEAWRFTDLRDVYSMRYAGAGLDEAALANAAALGATRAPAECSSVLVFVDGVFRADASVLREDADFLAKAGGYLGGLDEYKGDVDRVLEVFEKGEVSWEKGDVFAAVGSASARDVCVIDLPEDFSSERPLGVVFVSSGGESSIEAVASAPKLALLAGKGARCVLYEAHVAWQPEARPWSSSLPCSAFDLAEGSVVEHYFLNELPSRAHQIAHVHADVSKAASYKMRMVTLGGQVGRVNLGIDLNDTEANGEALGIMIADGDRIADLHSRINHNAPSCTSKQYQKNIASDHGRVVFSGKVIVEQVAQETDSDQLCRSMLLTDKARIDAMPVLEIAADQVKCTHGATVSDLSQEELFYLESRGISRVVAQELLLSSFALDVLEDCPFESLVLRVTKAARDLIPTIQKVDVTERALFQSV